MTTQAVTKPQTTDELWDLLTMILEDEFEIEHLQVTRSDKLIEDLDLDSLDLVQLMVILEEDLGITIDEVEAGTMIKDQDTITIGDLLTFLVQKLGLLRLV